MKRIKRALGLCVYRRCLRRGAVAADGLRWTRCPAHAIPSGGCRYCGRIVYDYQFVRFDFRTYHARCLSAVQRMPAFERERILGSDNAAQPPPNKVKALARLWDRNKRQNPGTAGAAGARVKKE